jgi:hypothetical protein
LDIMQSNNIRADQWARQSHKLCDHVCMCGLL